jgi:Spy/CpxP family protein refolding chaperone
MKKIITIFILLISITGSLSTRAQARFPLLRERINQAKLREIRFRLNLDEETFQKFRPVYLRYEDEVAGVDLQRLAGLNRIDADSLTNEQADVLLNNQMEVAKKLLVIREKYSHEFRTVLRPQQIIKLYQTEAELRRKVMAEIKRRMMGR